ncbi:MAG TPA: CbiX/SirB N-terminal domain-containing protein [Myxococcota bacterium]
MIVPAFFLHGQHTVVDIPQIVAVVRATARLAEPLLDHERLIDIVADLVGTTVTAPTIPTTVATRTTTRSDHISPLWRRSGWAKQSA